MALAAAPEVPGFRAPSPLGYGPTSTIYSAQSLTLGRWVALTVYSAHLSDDRAQRRFRRGYEMARRLGTHPHAVTVLEFGLTPDSQPYIATEIYERGTLEGRVEGRQPSSVSETLSTGIALAGALETAHRAGVIHGGVHPARVLLSADGEPALADLGLVPLVDRGGLAALVGPIAYHSPPEVLEGESITPATDVYSLASTLFTALTGRAPYARADLEDDTTAALLIRILQHDVPPLGRLDVPQSLEQVLRRALSCEPRDRPARPLAFAQALQTSQQELGLPVTQPVVLDIAASLAVAPTETTEPAPVFGVIDPKTGAGSGMEHVFVPYPTEAPSNWPSPAEQPAVASTRSDPLLTLPPLPPAVAPVATPAPVVLSPPAPAPAPKLAPKPAPVDDDDDRATRTRALPVIVLAMLVAVIFAGVTWSIVTGESTEGERAQPDSVTTAPGDGSTQSSSNRSGLTAVENSTGVQLDWDGGSSEPHVVLVLSTMAPPRSLPADTGTALSIPSANLDPAAGYCFAVVPAPDPLPNSGGLAAGIPDEALGPDACIRSGSATTVIRG